MIRQKIIVKKNNNEKVFIINQNKVQNNILMKDKISKNKNKKKVQYS